MTKKKIKKLINLLHKKKLKIAIAESCTGGLLSSSFTSISGASKVFLMGIITYSNQSKISNLKIKKKTISSYGSVSPQCCLEMVKNLKKISKSDVSISITGIAGPKGGTKNKPVGLVYLGIIIRKNIYIHKLNLKKRSRQAIQKDTVKTVIDKLLKILN
tara:strand:+ start:1657 stop:2133 length:477 start_codon:yes stop_codon:yes gene_type:complete